MKSAFEIKKEICEGEKGLCEVGHYSSYEISDNPKLRVNIFGFYIAAFAEYVRKIYLHFNTFLSCCFDCRCLRVAGSDYTRHPRVANIILSY